VAFDTAGNIVNDAAVEIGLSEVTDPYASTDANIIQLCRLLKSCGREMVHMHDWTHLRKEYTFTTVAGTDTYALPADFHDMLDQTWWNRTNRLPVGGPLSAQEWQYLKARLVGVVFTVLFRKMNQQIVLYPDGTSTPGGYDIAFEYNSAYWVSVVATPTVLSLDAPAASTDTVWFDGSMMTRFIKWKFLQAKGFDTSAAKDEFDLTFERVCGDDTPSPVLSLNNALRNQENDWLA
jgi:hypothetical protein